MSGELMLGDPDAGEKNRGMGLYWRIEKTIWELESASGSVVGATGAFYGVRRALLEPIPPETLLDDVYIPMQVVHAGKRVVFEPKARAWDLADQGHGPFGCRQRIAGHPAPKDLDPHTADPGHLAEAAISQLHLRGPEGS